MANSVATEKKRLVTYVSPEIAEQLQVIAELRFRTISNLLETILVDAVNQAIRSGEIQDRSISGKEKK